MSMAPSRGHQWAASGVSALLVLAAGVALAGAPQGGRVGAKAAPAPAFAVGKDATPVPASPPAAVAPSPALGLMAFLDPETGLLTGPIGPLVPSADLRAANVVLEEVPVPGGGWMIDLKGTLLEYYVLHVDALGSRTVSCVQDPRRVAPPPPSPAAPRAEER